MKRRWALHFITWSLKDLRATVLCWSSQTSRSLHERTALIKIVTKLCKNPKVYNRRKNEWINIIRKRQEETSCDRQHFKNKNRKIAINRHHMKNSRKNNRLLWAPAHYGVNGQKQVRNKLWDALSPRQQFNQSRPQNRLSVMLLQMTINVFTWRRLHYWGSGLHAKPHLDAKFVGFAFKNSTSGGKI